MDILEQYPVMKLKPKLSNDPEENASICEAAGYVSKYRAGARLPNGTFIEHGYGDNEELAVLALITDLSSRGRQQGAQPEQKEFIERIGEACEAYRMRRYQEDLGELEAAQPGVVLPRKMVHAMKMFFSEMAATSDAAMVDFSYPQRAECGVFASELQQLTEAPSEAQGGGE